MMAAASPTPIPQADVSLDTKPVRNVNAERQRRYRQSEKGRASYEARKRAKREDTRRRRNLRWSELNKFRCLDGLGRYGGPNASGIPRAADFQKRG